MPSPRLTTPGAIDDSSVVMLVCIVFRTPRRVKRLAGGQRRMDNLDLLVSGRSGARGVPPGSAAKVSGLGAAHAGTAAHRARRVGRLAGAVRAQGDAPERARPVLQAERPRAHGARS